MGKGKKDTSGERVQPIGLASKTQGGTRKTGRRQASSLPQPCLSAPCSWTLDLSA